MRTAAAVAALGAYWGWVLRSLNLHPISVKLMTFVRKRVLRVATCGRKWRIPRCRDCGHKLTAKARLVEACDSMTCPFCARRKAQKRRWAIRKWVEAHEAARVKGKLSRDFYLVTWTVPKRPWMAVDRIREDATLAFKACKRSWEKVLRFLPKKVGETHYPGECEDAGMFAFLEVGAGGMVHVTALFYGAYHRVEELRPIYEAAVPGGKNWQIKAVGRGQGRKRALAKLVNEACKYVTKGTVGGKDELQGGGAQLHEFTHTLLCMLAEIALHERNRVRCYGTAIGALAEEEEDGKDDHEDEGLPESCPECGAVHMERKRNADEPLEAGYLVNVLWEWVEEERPYAWCPAGWGGGNRAPPDVEPAAPRPRTVKVRLGGAGSELVEMTLEEAAARMGGKAPAPALAETYDAKRKR